VDSTDTAATFNLDAPILYPINPLTTIPFEQKMSGPVTL